MLHREVLGNGIYAGAKGLAAGHTPLALLE